MSKLELMPSVFVPWFQLVTTLLRMRCPMVRRVPAVPKRWKGRYSMWVVREIIRKDILIAA
jgi:hypothetical protein